jgi:hypothetical protein
MLFRRIVGSLIAGLIFFLAQVAIIMVVSYILASIKGLRYDFQVALRESVRFGLSFGSAIALLAFIAPARRRPPS